MSTGDATRGNGHQPDRVVFEYLKSQYFRVIHADGAIGSVTPHGHIHVAIYSERPAIPRKMAFARTDQGALGAELPEERVAREGIVREMDVDIIMSVAVAESLKTWLSTKIDEARLVIAAASEMKQ